MIFTFFLNFAPNFLLEASLKNSARRVDKQLITFFARQSLFSRKGYNLYKAVKLGLKKAFLNRDFGY